MTVQKKRNVEGAKVEPVAEMDVSLNPHVEKNWRRFTIAILVGKGNDHVKEEKPLSKTALKKLETERRVLEKSKLSLEWISFKSSIEARKDEFAAKMRRYEQRTTDELIELVELRGITVDVNFKRGGKCAYVMALIRADILKGEPGSSSTASSSSASSSSGTKKEIVSPWMAAILLDQLKRQQEDERLRRK